MRWNDMCHLILTLILIRIDHKDRYQHVSVRHYFSSFLHYPCIFSVTSYLVLFLTSSYTLYHTLTYILLINVIPRCIWCLRHWCQPTASLLDCWFHDTYGVVLTHEPNGNEWVFFTFSTNEFWNNQHLSYESCFWRSVCIIYLIN